MNVYTRKVYIRVDAVNDAPVLIIPGSSHEYVRHGKFEITNVNTLFIEEDEELFIDGVSVVDVDVDYEQALTSHVEFFELIIEVNHGTVTLDTYDMLFVQDIETPIGPNLGRIHCLGPLQSINQALRRVLYNADKDYNGDDYLYIWIGDRGHIGDPPLSDNATIPITIHAKNDVPEWKFEDLHEPRTIDPYEDSVVVISGVSVYDADVEDAGCVSDEDIAQYLLDSYQYESDVDFSSFCAFKLIRCTAEFR